MMRQTFVSTLAVLALGVSAVACKAGGVGDPCIPNLEYSPNTDAPAETGADVEDRSFQCETRVCLTNHFRGRVSCPFGNAAGRAALTHPVTALPSGVSAEAAENCFVPGTTVPVKSLVKPQCSSRKDNVYCSCRCAGAATNIKYCECPEGFACAKVTGIILPSSTIKADDQYCVRLHNDSTQDNQTCSDNESCDYQSAKDGAGKEWCGYTQNSAKLE
jgi:hypothetical protein